MEPEHLLAGVAQGAMAEIVKQGRGVQHPFLVVQTWIELLQPAESETCQMKHPQRVGEAT